MKDLHYGEALFQLYQEAYFPAIIRLLAAREQGLMKAYEDEPELLLGGLYLAYGMPNTAESLFERVINQSAEPEIKDKAWLHLGKARHRRGEPDSAEKALGEIGEALPAEGMDEKRYLQGLIDLQRNTPEKAISDLSDVSAEGEWSLYARYNQAIAHLRSDRPAEALAILQEIGDARSEADTAETRALRDQANLALGYLLLENQQPESAKTALQKVRLQSSASNRALLGLGWASLQLNQQEQALVPWQLLAGRNTSDPAVLEAKLAIPYVFATLEAEQQSLQAYRDAISAYDDALAGVERIIQQVDREAFPDNLIAASGAESASASAEFRSLLPYLLSGNLFQERLQDYQDLLRLEDNLQQWQRKTDSYRTMLLTQEQAYEQKLPQVETHLQGDRLEQLTSERDALFERYQQAASDAEPAFILATEKEKKQLARLQRIDDLIAGSGAPQRLQGQQDIARLLQGILTWQTVTEHPERLWTLKKQMRELDQNLEIARTQEQQLAQAKEQAASRFTVFGTRIDSLEERIPQLLKQVTQARVQQAAQLRGMALDKLDQRRNLINNYLIQARFGVANLLDISSERGVTPQ
ncbi:MAG: tetratricopeptide repeat protein [Candidatus Thiodiazotropha sp.]